MPRTDQNYWKVNCSSEQFNRLESLQAGRITASNVHEVLHTDQNNPAKSLIKKLCTESKNINHVPAIKWGRENEGNTLKAYQKILEKNQSGVIIEKFGLRMHEKYHFLGASPDGLVTWLCHESSLLEIKCPAKHKDNLSINDCIATDKEFCLEIFFLLKSSHKYYAQVQMQMYLYGLKACHFVIWTLMFCTGALVPYDDSFTKKVPVLVEFHKKHVEILIN